MKTRMPEVIDRLRNSEGGLRAVAAGDCGSFFPPNQLAPQCNIHFFFVRNQLVKGYCAVQTKSVTSFIGQTSFLDINCLL